MTRPVTISTRHIPPSVNACYSNVKGKGRVKTKRYREWAQAAGWDFNGKGCVTGPFDVAITIDRSRRHASADIDNRIKPTLDLLQAHGVIEDDRLCESVRCAWGEADGGMIIHVFPAHSNATQAMEKAA